MTTYQVRNWVLYFLAHLTQVNSCEHPLYIDSQSVCNLYSFDLFSRTTYLFPPNFVQIILQENHIYFVVLRTCGIYQI
jgi:hypothetical protein